MLFELVLATRNNHKVRELRALLADIVNVHSLSEYPNMPEVDETGDSFIANAILKAEAVARHTGTLSLADDSGIEVDALGGAPGIYSARYAGAGATDALNRQKLLAELEQLPESQRTARFVSAVAVAGLGLPTWTATGIHVGYITFTPRGSGDFGYDPIFYSPELGATFAEVPVERKNQVSHRARALAQVRAYLLQLQNITRQ